MYSRSIRLRTRAGEQADGAARAETAADSDREEHAVRVRELEDAFRQATSPIAGLETALQQKAGPGDAAH